MNYYLIEKYLRKGWSMRMIKNEFYPDMVYSTFVSRVKKHIDMTGIVRTKKEGKIHHINFELVCLLQNYFSLRQIMDLLEIDYTREKFSTALNKFKRANNIPIYRIKKEDPPIEILFLLQDIKNRKAGKSK